MAFLRNFSFSFWWSIYAWPVVICKNYWWLFFGALLMCRRVGWDGVGGGVGTGRGAALSSLLWVMAWFEANCEMKPELNKLRMKTDIGVIVQFMLWQYFVCLCLYVCLTRVFVYRPILTGFLDINLFGPYTINNNYYTKFSPSLREASQKKKTTSPVNKLPP